MNKSESKYFHTAVKMNHALITLLKTKPFEYITVSELCKAAGVNRSTFYLHYETVADLLEETARHLIDEFLSYFGEDATEVVWDIAGCDKQELNFINEKYLTPYLAYIRDHKEVFLTALENKRSFGFERVYARMYQSIFDPILEKFHYPQGDRKYVMMYYLNGITAVVTEWLKDDCRKPIADISRIICECIFGLNGECMPLS